MRPVLFAHGLEGHPEGRKPTALRASGLAVTAPDGRKRPLIQRVQGLLEALETLDRPVLVGSSYGGLGMLAIVRDHPDTFAGLVLCAPALIRNEPPVEDPDLLIAPPGTVVVHGRHDRVIPLQASRDLVARSPGTTLIEVDDDHRLAQSTGRIVTEVLNLVGGSA